MMLLMFVRRRNEMEFVYYFSGNLLRKYSESSNLTGESMSPWLAS